ncbi:MAG: disulfide bond formation protein DsbB [Rhodomicrobium sp.]|nr:MAG: disulfide bond formation protein DsbB [Rhodomicrobium sp.]
MLNLSNRAELLMGLIFMISLALILGALGFQHLGGLAPCDLCYKQRWVYYVAIAAVPVGLFLYDRDFLKASKLLMFVLAAAFFANMILGIYHAGVEWEFWSGPQGCSGSAPLDATIDLFESLKSVKPVACNEVQWRFLGISMAGYSALASLFLAIISVYTSQAATAKN